MAARLPELGRSGDEVLSELREMKGLDADWRHGRVPLYVFKANDEVDRVGREAFVTYFAENALGSKRAFLSLGRMEREVVEMGLGLFGAPEDAQGFMTTGGTESIIQAVRACRNHARAMRGAPRHRGNIVVPVTAHLAFDKAADLMDLEVRRTPVGQDFRADPEALAQASDDDTIMWVGSAPCFPFGVVDPIAGLAEQAKARGIWLHVDACVGGYLAPFVKMNGGDVPDFDFAIPGVSSLSADLHKFGFTPKPASTVFYRSMDLAAHHGFALDGWPSGPFVTSTIVGTRPGGGVAGAWATLQLLGVTGYRAIARDLMAMVGAYRAGVSRIEGLHVLGDPHLSIVAVGARDVDVFRVAEVLAAKGWVPGLVREPMAIHRMMSMLHAPSLDAYLADLAAAVAEVRGEADRPAGVQASY